VTEIPVILAGAHAVYHGVVLPRVPGVMNQAAIGQFWTSILLFYGWDKTRLQMDCPHKSLRFQIAGVIWEKAAAPLD
jgi:hypothetical protein